MADPLSLLLALAALPAQTAPVADADGAPPLSREVFDTARPARTSAVPAAPRTVTSTFRSLNVDPEGDMPRDAAFTPDGARVLVCNRDTDTVTVFDAQTRTAVGHVTVGDFPVDVAVAPNGLVAATADLLDDTVTLIDLQTLTVLGTVPLTHNTAEGQPYRLAFDPNTGLLIVSLIDGATVSRFSVVDPVAQTETLSFPTTPHGAYGFFGTPESGIFGNLFTTWALSPDGTFVLVPDRGGDTLESYDLSTGAHLASLPVGDVPAHVDIAPNGLRAVCTLSGTLDATVVLSLSAGVPTITGTVPTSLSAFDPLVRVTPNGDQAVVGVQNAVEFVDLVGLSSLGTVSTGTVGDLEFTFDDLHLVVTNYTTRVIDLATRTVVAQLSHASTYDAAISPVNHRLVGLNNRFAEDVHFYRVNGASAAFRGAVATGSAPEVDAPRRIAVTPDGRRALITGLSSRSVAEVDAVTGDILHVYDAGDRVWQVAITPDGTTGVVTSMDANQVQILDLTTHTVAATLNVATRPSEIAISPDGTRAYTTSIAGTDRVWAIDLAGAASSVGASLPAGQLGSLLYSYNQASGIALSPDGATLAVCVSFDDELLLVDTATMTTLIRVPVGDFPIRAAWTADGSSLFVSCPFDDTVHRVAFAGAGSTNTGSATGVQSAFTVDVGENDAYVYVGEYDLNADSLAVLDATTLARVGTVFLSGRPGATDRYGDTLFVAADAFVERVALAGPGSQVVESGPVVATPADLAFAAGAGLALTPQLGADDGLDLTSFGGTASNACPGNANSTGVPGELAMTGALLAGGFPLTLTATHLPPLQFGLLLASRTTAVVPNPGGSQGILCLGGTIGRFNAQLAAADAAGALSIPVDTTAIPEGGVFSTVLAGETWSFQLWHRDVNPVQTSNFTNRATATFD